MLQFFKEKIGYQFADAKLLDLALEAAHRERENDLVRSDGNRGLARIGLLAIQMTETYTAVLIEKLSMNDTNSREYWWDTKKGRARVCKALGIDPYIKQSVRQGDQPPPTAVLDSALSAIFGAVWLDGLQQGQSADEIQGTISMVLRHVNAALTEPSSTTDGCSGNQIQEESLQETTAPPSTFKEISGPLISDETEDTSWTEILWSEEAHQAEFHSVFQDGMLEVQHVQTNNLQDDPLDLGLLNQFQSAHMILPDDFTTGLQVSQADDSYPGAPNDEGAVMMSYANADHDGMVPEAPAPIAKKKRRREATNRARLAYTEFIHEEQRKLTAVLQADPIHSSIDSKRFLNHPDFNPSEDDSMPFHFLYSAIGSLGALIDFSEQLLNARKARDPISETAITPQSAADIFQTISSLESEEASCVLIKRFYAVKLLQEEEQFHNELSNDIFIETQETMSVGGRARMGNPNSNIEAALINKQTSRIKPNLNPSTPEFTKARRKVKRIRQIAKRLQGLVNLFGIGILALLPSGPSFSRFVLTDHNLLEMKLELFPFFCESVKQGQGLLLKILSEAVEPALIALATFSLRRQQKFDIEKLDLALQKDTPKAFLSI